MSDRSDDAPGADVPTDRPEPFDQTNPTNGERPDADTSAAFDKFDKTTETEALSSAKHLDNTARPSPSRASVPPSEPRSTSRASFSQVDLSADRPARLQMIIALVLGLVLVAIPLYLWRRPRAESIAATGSADAGVDPNAATASTTTAPVDEGKPTVGEPKNILCQDPGTKKTSPEQCDHLADVEKAFAKAIEDTAVICVPKDAGGGTIQFVADVSFKRHALSVSTPKEGRTMKNGKVVSACQSAVKTRLQAVALESVQHAHARYKIGITASYPGTVK